MILAVGGFSGFNWNEYTELAAALVMLTAWGRQFVLVEVVGVVAVVDVVVTVVAIEVIGVV